MAEADAAWRIFRAVWNAHYRIPQIAYLALLPISVVVLFLTLGLGFAATFFSLFGLVLPVQGVVRWQYAKRRSSGAVIVPIFRGADRAKAIEIQDTIIKTLHDQLTAEEMRSVHRVPTTVSQADHAYAARLCKRLRGFLVLQGDLRQGSNGNWSVYASACQTLSPGVIHLDLFTRDITPAKASWRWVFRRLTGTDYLPQCEYPLEFADELSAVVQATAGQLALAVGDHARAERLLKAAIKVAPQSRSAQIDLLRVNRAHALVGLDKEDQALRLLRKRSCDTDASLSYSATWL